VDNNWLENRANRWYKAGLSPDDGAGTTLFSDCVRNGSRRELGPNSNSCETTNFMPLDRVLPVELNTHSLGGSCLESMAPEFAKLQPVNKEVTGLGFTNKYTNRFQS
jgi:hypothetical protein